MCCVCFLARNELPFVEVIRAIKRYYAHTSLWRLRGHTTQLATYLLLSWRRFWMFEKDTDFKIIFDFDVLPDNFGCFIF